MIDFDDSPDTDGTDGPVDHEAQRVVRELLRTEPVDVDPLRRDQAIRAALQAAADGTESPTPAVTPVRRDRPARRRSVPRFAPRPALVAAALLLLVTGGVMAWSNQTRQTADSAASAGDDRATDTDSHGAEESVADDPLTAATVPTTTMPTTAVVTATPDLGAFASADELLAAAAHAGDESPRQQPEDAATSEAVAPMPPCAVAVDQLGATVIATATLEDRAVVVLRDPVGVLVVLDQLECTELARR